MPIFTTSISCLSAIAVVSTPAVRSAELSPAVVSNFGHLPLGFEQNTGQTAPEVQWLARTAESIPVTSGAYQKVCGPASGSNASSGGIYCGTYGATSACVTKISADGTQLIYST